jgi:Flp pilus assembly protein CpaB
VKKKNNFLPFIIAGLLAVIGLVILVKWNQAKEQERQAAIQAQRDADAKALAEAQEHQQVVVPTVTNMRPVLYATQPVEPGVRISPAFYEKKQTPNDILPDAFTDKNDITGWVAIRHIEKGDPLTPRNVNKTAPFLTERIPPGMRAISLPIFNADANNTGGFVVDGDRVDLLYTVTNASGQLVNTQMVLQNIDVLFVPGPPTKDSDQIDGINPIPTPGSSIAVTFEVTPEEAQELTFLSGAKDGKFSMILRARKDNTEIKIKPFTLADYDLNNLSKVQRTADKSEQRVKALALEIEAKEKAAQGNTNETNTPPAAP